jgi:N-acetylglucosaminyl-diphospho-decaprenol L-rhamnosyltransferase
MPSILTIILNWRSADMTLRSAEATLAALDGLDAALVIVDNDSQDGSEETLRAAAAGRGWDRGPHQLRVVQAGRNGGYGAGNNAGMRAGLPDGRTPDFVWIVNSDAFPEPGAARALLAHFAANPRTGMAGSGIYGDDGVPHNSCFRFPSIASEFEGQIRFGPITRLLSRNVVPMPIPEQETPVDWISGASLMIRQRVLDQIGQFDETFFLYFEETDLCRRAVKAGWTNYYVPASRVMHIGGVSTGIKTARRIPRYWLDSRRHYFTKNHGHLYAALATAVHVAAGTIWQIRRVVERRPPQDPPGYLRDFVAHALSAGGQVRRSA